MPVLPLVFTDISSGATTAACPNCRIKKLPNVKRGKEVTVSEWIILCGNMEMFVGGNPASVSDQKLVGLSFGGVPIVGQADGDWLEIDMTEDAWKPYCGTDGEVAWARQYNKMATVKIMLKQTSPSNDVLSAFLRTDQIPAAV